MCPANPQRTAAEHLRARFEIHRFRLVSLRLLLFRNNLHGITVALFLSTSMWDFPSRDSCISQSHKTTDCKNSSINWLCKILQRWGSTFPDDMGFPDYVGSPDHVGSPLALHKLRLTLASLSLPSETYTAEFQGLATEIRPRHQAQDPHDAEVNGQDDSFMISMQRKAPSAQTLIAEWVQWICRTVVPDRQIV